MDATIKVVFTVVFLMLIFEALQFLKTIAKNFNVSKWDASLSALLICFILLFVNSTSALSTKLWIGLFILIIGDHISKIQQIPSMDLRKMDITDIIVYLLNIVLQICWCICKSIAQVISALIKGSIAALIITLVKFNIRLYPLLNLKPVESIQLDNMFSQITSYYYVGKIVYIGNDLPEFLNIAVIAMFILFLMFKIKNSIFVGLTLCSVLYLL
jgi:hypothetical protein